MKRFLAIVLVLMLCLGIVSSASALATKKSGSTSKYVYQYPKDSGDSSFTKVVMSSKGKVTVSLNKEYLAATNVNTVTEAKGGYFYPAVQVKIFKVESNGSLTKVQDFDIWKSSGVTKTLEAGTYKLQVYAWNPDTTAKSYYKSIATSSTEGCWLNKPVVTIKAGSNCKLYNW